MNHDTFSVKTGERGGTTVRLYERSTADPSSVTVKITTVATEILVGNVEDAKKLCEDLSKAVKMYEGYAEAMKEYREGSKKGGKERV